MKTSQQTKRHVLAGLSLVVAAAFSGGVFAASGGPGMVGPGAMMGPGAGGGSMGGGPGGIFQGMLLRLLDRVNASAEQRAQIQQILQSNAADLRAQHEAGRALREQAMSLFAQPTVDAAAVEALRQKQLAMHDAASKRMTAMMLEISRVLTSEQRKQMADYMNQRRDMMQRHWRERQAIDAPKS
jgi:Spy/CpxP family protein refolding chaperone